MKKLFIQITVTAYILGGLILIIGKESWFPEFYNPDFLSVIAFISAFLIILTQLLFKSADEEKNKAVLNLQTIIAISLVLSAFGGLGLYQLYQYGFEYDKLTHFIIPLILTIASARFFNKYYEIEKGKALALGVVLVMIGGFLWEVLEFLFDWYLGTQTLGQYGLAITKDTIIDIIFNALGVLGGAIILKNKNLW